MLLLTLKMAGAMLLSYIFVSAGLHKLTNTVSFRQVLSDYDLLPRNTIYPSLLLLASLEVVTGICLLIMPLVSIGASMAIGLLFLYMAAIAINLMRGNELQDCGCGGPAQGQRLSGWLLLRNLLLLCFATALLWPSAGIGVPWLLTLPTALFLIGLYHVGDQLLLNKSKLDNLKVYLEET